MKNTLLLMMCLLSVNSASAQSDPVAVLKQTLKRIDDQKSIQYSTRFTEVNPFSAGDTTRGKKISQLQFDEKGACTFFRETTWDAKGKALYSVLYEPGKRYSISLSDSTYAIEQSKDKQTHDLGQLSALIKEEIQKHPAQIFTKADTLFEGEPAYHFTIKAYDRVEHGEHNYTHHEILISRKTGLPMYYSHRGSGSATKGGISIGRIHFFSEDIYSNILLNPKIKIDLQIPSGFRKAHTAMLKSGETIPELQVQKMSGETVADAYFKNKVRLVVFGSTGCPANPLANPMLNRLQAKYHGPGFALLNIYTSETATQVKQYVQSNSLQFPVYTGSRKLSYAFQTLGTPNFYLTDQKGQIVYSSNGYSETLEAELSKAIDLLLNKTP